MNAVSTRGFSSVAVSTRHLLLFALLLVSTLQSPQLCTAQDAFGSGENGVVGGTAAGGGRTPASGGGSNTAAPTLHCIMNPSVGPPGADATMLNRATMGIIGQSVGSPIDTVVGVNTPSSSPIIYSCSDCSSTWQLLAVNNILAAISILVLLTRKKSEMWVMAAGV